MCWQPYFIGIQLRTMPALHCQMRWECSVYRWVRRWNAGPRGRGIRCPCFPRLFSRATLDSRSTVQRSYFTTTSMLVSFPTTNSNLAALSRRPPVARPAVLPSTRTGRSVFCRGGLSTKRCVHFCCTSIASLYQDRSRYPSKGFVSHFWRSRWIFF